MGGGGKTVTFQHNLFWSMLDDEHLGLGGGAPPTEDKNLLLAGLQ